MKVIQSKATSNGRRHQLNIQKNLLSKNSRFLRSTIVGKKQFFGRSSITGNITAWHRGGGAKRIFRSIDFLNEEKNYVVLSTMYDPYRSAFISLNFDIEKNILFRTLSTNNIYPGAFIKCGFNIDELKLGYRTKIANIPTGSIIHNLSIASNKKAQYIKAAGTFGQIIQCGNIKSKVRLPSNKIINIFTDSFCTLGVVSNIQNNLTSIGKAGRERLSGRRPIVRGIAMNPVDHPHGGRGNGGRPSVTPWGLPTKGKFYLRKKK